MEIHKLELSHRRTTWMMGRVDRLEKLKTRSIIFARGAKRLSLLRIWAKQTCVVWLVVVQFSSHVQLFATPWTAACQASLTLTISWSLPKLMSICQCFHFKKVVLKWQRCVVTQPELLRSSEFPPYHRSVQAEAGWSSKVAFIGRMLILGKVLIYI